MGVWEFRFPEDLQHNGGRMLVRLGKVYFNVSGRDQFKSIRRNPFMDIICFPSASLGYPGYPSLARPVEEVG
jgi:hypothetical protein